MEIITWKCYQSKLKKFVENNFRFDENVRKLSKQAEKSVGKDLYIYTADT